MALIAKMTGAVSDEFSKIGFFRSLFPALKTRYMEEVANSAKRARFMRGYPKLFWYTKIAFWLYAPRKFVGGLIGSVLGLHVVRHYWFNALFKPKGVSEKYKELSEQGVQLLPKFLSEDDLAKMREFYSKHYEEREVYLKDFNELVISSNLPHVDNPQANNSDYIELFNWLDQRLDFRGIYRQFAGRELSCKPWVSIIHNKSFPQDENLAPQADGNNTPHRDVFFPSYKIFVYLNDVNEDNAAFRYYPSSHRIKDYGIADVYMDSIRHYTGDPSQPFNPLQENAGYKVQSCNGSAGDAVLFNVQGIHRRGEYKKDKDRERLVLLIDFRQNDAPILRSDYKWK